MQIRVKNLYKRGEWYYFRMDTPLAFRNNFPKCINESLGTRDPVEAAILAEKKRKYYKSIFKGEKPAEITETNIRMTAKEQGLEQYLPSDTIKNRSDIDMHHKILERVAFMLDIKGRAPQLETVSAGGALKVERFTLERALERYIEITPEKWKNLSPREYQKKYNPLRLTFENFAKAGGKVDDFLNVTPARVVEYRNQRVADVHAGKIVKGTYNKEVSWLGMIFDELAKVHAPEKLSLNPFRKMTLKDDSAPGKRKPFTDKDLILIREKLVTSPPLEEVAALMTIAEHTGAGCRELALLMPEDIVLVAEIPYIRIAPNEMRRKAKHGGARHRDIPLVGPALAAARQFSGGFPRYRKDNGGEALSAYVSKWLPPGVAATFNGFRHRIQDSLRNTECIDTLKDSIVGHSSDGMRMHYGEGYTLAAKKQALEKAIAYSEENIKKARERTEQ